MTLKKLHAELSKDESYRRAYAEEDLVHRVAERVYRLRKKLNLSQEELAERLNTKQPRIAMLEGGFANLTLRRLARVAYALDCRPEDLVDRDTPVLLRGDWCREGEEEPEAMIIELFQKTRVSDPEIVVQRVAEPDDMMMVGGV